MLFLTRFFNHGKHRTHGKGAEPFLRSVFRVFRVFRGLKIRPMLDSWYCFG